FGKLANKNGVKYSHVWHPSAGCQISVMGYTLKLCAYVSMNAIKCYLVLFSVIYYILLGLTEIIKFLFGHFFAVNIYSYIMKKKMKAIPFKHA
ncbi:hypothetical protein ACTQ50_18255, partial [Blautia sp. Sow4_E7]|uniref:hypothetical protein n=1 Tax=Blautia sp. Sow4_E7 TaxID=3438749 RepID=UPI003F8E9D36